MKLIRNNVFETNSSSTHSISITKGVDILKLDNLLPDEDGFLDIDRMEFGWEYNEYNDAMSKASYAMIYAEDWSRGNKEKYIKILVDLLKEMTGAIEITWGDVNDYFPIGSIDHQSVENGDLDYMFEDPNILKKFIFDRESWLTTDNDNN